MALKAVLAEQITALVDAGFTQFLSGMAEATDTWSALSVLNLREKNPAIKLHCILPCKEQADKWSASSRDLYHSILERAATVRYAQKMGREIIVIDPITRLISHGDIVSEPAHS